ncbi:MAG TPA: beta-propeller fold lactonase family protein, partial [Armatimonadota bacterium]
MMRVKAPGTVCWWALFAMVCLSLPGCNDNDNTISGESQGTVYAMTNAANGNAVVAYRRKNDGTLAFLNSFRTGGNGTGTGEVSTATPQDGIDPLASQGSLRLSRDKRFLFAVNAGSNSVTSFRVSNNGGLDRVSVRPSGGAQPNSLASAGNLLYVSNVGNAGNAFASNVTGFRVGNNGSLTQIAGSTHALSTANAQPSAMAFSPDGTLLAVSEITTNTISVFTVNADGTLTGPVANPASGPAPFGSVFLTTGPLLVAEASGALSSYNVAANGTLSVISGSVATGQTATCWVSVTPDQQFAYTSNTGSNDITSFTIGAGGTLTVLEAVASTVEGAGSSPTDNGISADGGNLYVLD